MAEEGEDRFDGLLLRLAEEHKEGGISKVSLWLPHVSRDLAVSRVAVGHFLWVLEKKDGLLHRSKWR